MSTETESARSCLGWQCLVAKPENPEQAGWRDGYCPDCQNELARDEIREERQEARNEMESTTPITDQCRQQMVSKGWADKQPVWGLLFNMADLELQLAEAMEKVAYTESHGLHIGRMVTTDKPEGFLAHEYRQGSTLARIFDEWSESIGMKRRLEQAQEQRDRLADALKAIEWSNSSEWQSNCAKCALAALDRKEVPSE